MGGSDGFRAAGAGLRAEHGLEHEATIVGAFPVIAGARARRAKGLEPVAPDPTVSHAADTLRMLQGRAPAAREVPALDAYLVTASDHVKTAGEALATNGTDLPVAGEVEAYIRAALRKKNPERPLETNVEFFTAILLDALAIPRQAFKPIFTVARAARSTAPA